MAEALDVQNALADAIDALVQPLVGEPYPTPGTIDAEQRGDTQTLPGVTVTVSRPRDTDLETMLKSGQSWISVDASFHDALTQQYINEGKSDVLLSRDPLTIAAEPTVPFTIAGVVSSIAWILSGSATPGNLIGLQSGLVGASYVVVAGDTINSIAAGLAAAAVAQGLAIVADGDLISSTDHSIFSINVGSPANYLAAVSRIVQNFDAIIWSSSPYDRWFLSSTVQRLYKVGAKIAMSDTSVAAITGIPGAQPHDAEVREGLFVSRVRWVISYTVTQTQQKIPIVAYDGTLEVEQSATPLGTTILLASQL